MKSLTYEGKVAVLRILYDIILADKKIDGRETKLFGEVSRSLGIESITAEEVLVQSPLLSLAIIKDFATEDKLEFAKLMGKMIVVDRDINYNEVKLYSLITEFCGIDCEFKKEDYPEFV